MIPSETFRDWMRRYDEWRAFLFDLLSQRLASTMALVDEVVFHRMDARVAALLLRRASQGSIIQVTHQEIAAELGTSREVISRILEGFDAAGLIAVARGQVEIMDPGELEARAEM
jgi:CRP/FNR family transcriptional regulator